MMSTGNTDVKEEIKKTVQLIITNLNVKPSECILKNYDTITKNALSTLLKIFPELSNDINALISKFAEIQENVKKLIGTTDISEYADSILSIFAVYRVNPGIYAAFTALQAAEAMKTCGDADAKFFVARTILAGALPYELYVLLIDYLGMDRAFPVTLFKALLETTK
ncbi:hypothetical protein [Vulcanisaeta distributa]|uniref:hypothetical protein n=1 Tax=Vulcanisaeta distributa TaxID=164451 RepID=UPI0006D23958|nr:hypothetical protein [Vulcanisaeta distributa]